MMKKFISLIIILVLLLQANLPAISFAVDETEENVEIKQNEIKTQNAAENTESPIIDVDSLEINKKAVLYGETITISINIIDNIDVTYANITYEMPISKELKDIRLYKNNSTGNFEGNLTIDDNFEKGIWQILLIVATDASGNTTSMYNSNLNNYMPQIDDLSAGNFNVIGEDTESPNINAESLEINKKTATTGDIINLSIDITDNYNVSYAQVTYQMPKSKEYKNVKLFKNDYTGKYEANIEIDDSFEQGKWKIVYIIASDDALNINTIHNSNINAYIHPIADLSEGDFTVIIDNDFEAIDGVEVFKTNTYISNQIINGDVYIGPKAVVVLDNVTVNGSIYVLGGARLISVSATNLYASNMKWTSHYSGNEVYNNGTVYYYRTELAD